MVNKEYIIYSVGDYTPGEIARFILDGVVTYEELCEEPEFSYMSRKMVKKLLENAQPVNDEDWRHRPYRSPFIDDIDDISVIYGPPPIDYEEPARRAEDDIIYTGEDKFYQVDSDMYGGPLPDNFYVEDDEQFDDTVLLEDDDDDEPSQPKKPDNS